MGRNMAPKKAARYNLYRSKIVKDKDNRSRSRHFNVDAQILWHHSNLFFGPPIPIHISLLYFRQIYSPIHYICSNRVLSNEGHFDKISDDWLPGHIKPLRAEHFETVRFINIVYHFHDTEMGQVIENSHWKTRTCFSYLVNAMSAFLLKIQATAPAKPNYDYMLPTGGSTVNVITHGIQPHVHMCRVRWNTTTTCLS